MNHFESSGAFFAGWMDSSRFNADWDKWASHLACEWESWCAGGEL